MGVRPRAPGGQREDGRREERAWERERKETAVDECGWTEGRRTQVDPVAQFYAHCFYVGME